MTLQLCPMTFDRDILQVPDVRYIGHYLSQIAFESHWGWCCDSVIHECPFYLKSYIFIMIITTPVVLAVKVVYQSFYVFKGPKMWFVIFTHQVFVYMCRSVPLHVPCASKLNWTNTKKSFTNYELRLNYLSTLYLLCYLYSPPSL